MKFQKCFTKDLKNHIKNHMDGIKIANDHECNFIMEPHQYKDLLELYRIMINSGGQSGSYPVLEDLNSENLMWTNTNWEPESIPLEHD